MIRVCVYCGRILGEKPPLEDKSETHTICEGCLEKMKHDYPHYFEEEKIREKIGWDDENKKPKPLEGTPLIETLGDIVCPSAEAED